MIERPDLARAPGFERNRERIQNRQQIDEVIAAWCAPLPVYEALGRLLEAGLVAAKLNTFAEAAREPHVVERDMLQPMTLWDGSVAPLTGPAAKFSRTPTRIRSAAPQPGDHTEEILAELGFDDAARAALRADRVV